MKFLGFLVLMSVVNEILTSEAEEKADEQKIQEVLETNPELYWFFKAFFDIKFENKVEMRLKPDHKPKPHLQQILAPPIVVYMPPRNPFFL